MKELEQLDKLIKDYPTNYVYHNKKGAILLNMDNYIEAIECFTVALTLNEEYIDALFNKGVAFCDAGKYDLAIQYFDKVIQSVPKNNQENQLRSHAETMKNWIQNERDTK